MSDDYNGNADSSSGSQDMTSLDGAPSQDLLAAALQAVHTLYHNADAQAKAEANAWLTHFSTGDDGWSVAWQLMDEANSLEARFYGITILEEKVRRHWGGIDNDTRSSLCQGLLDKLAPAYRDGFALFNKLAVALCALLIKGAPEVIEAFERSVIDALASLEETDGEGTSQIAAYSFFKVLGEELKGRFISARRVHIVEAEMSRAKQQILTWCSETFAGNYDDAVKHEALACAAAWTLIYPAPELSLQLVDAAFLLMQSNDLVPMACKLVSETLVLDELYSSDEPLLQMAQRILDTREQLDYALENSLEEVATALIGVVVEFGTQHMRTLTNSPEVLQLFVQYALAITNMPGQVPREENISIATFSFWHKFVDTIVDLDEELCSDLKAEYGESLSRLVLTFAQKSTHCTNDFDEGELEDFLYYRQRMGEVASYIYMFLKDDALVFLVNELEAALERHSTASVESLLFFVSQSADAFEGDLAMPARTIDVMAAVSPGEFFPLDQTCIVTCSHLAQWLSHNSSAIATVMDIIQQRLEMDDLVETAAAAFKSICRECDRVLPDLLDPLLSLALPMIAPAHSAKARRYFSEGLCWVLSHCRSDVVLRNISSLSEPIFEEFSRSVLEPSEAAIEVLTDNLSILARIIYCLSPEIPERVVHPVFLLLEECIGHFESIMAQYSMCEDVVKAICTCFNHFLQTLDVRVGPLFAKIVAFATSGLDTTLNPSFLDLISDAMAFSHEDSEVARNLVAVFEAVFNKVFALSQAGGDDAVEPAVFARFFHLVYRTGRSSHLVLTEQSEETLQQLLTFMIQGTEFSEVEVVKEASAALGMFIEKASHSADLDTLVLPCLEGIVSTFTLLAARGCDTAYLLLYADVLYKIFQRDGDSFCALLIQVLKEIDACDSSGKEALVSSISGRSRLPKSRFQSAFVRFRSACLGSNKPILID